MEITQKETEKEILSDIGLKEIDEGSDKEIPIVENFDESAAAVKEFNEGDNIAEAVSNDDKKKDKAPDDIKRTRGEMPEKESLQKTLAHNEIKNTEKTAKEKAESQKAIIFIKRTSAFRKIITLALLTFIVVGVVIYFAPSLLRKESKPLTDDPRKIAESIQIKNNSVKFPKSISEHEMQPSIFEDADRLREELLEKREEIEELKFNYENGITELEERIIQQIQKEGITTYSQGIKNKQIELDLRMIQRRKAYIRELEKPARWLYHGSEELLYLRRKAQFDMQLIDSVSGIDLDEHMRHLSAALQKYRLSADTLAINIQNPDVQPFEVIWDQIINLKKTHEQTPIATADKEILKDICSGNVERLAELSSIPIDAAKCLSKVSGSGLFLNGVTELSPAAAKYLFQWQGNWICLNGLKKLTPETARYLFQWEGHWISLNGLTNFPPESAKYLLKWNGKQLELMGLKGDKKKSDHRALKYMARWETAGGKLFVTEEVRKEIEQVR
jgi:hypothetical protein